MVREREYDTGTAPLLTADEEKALARRIAGGDLGARNQLAEANLRLVASIAKHFAGRGLPIEDLIGYGTEGLLTAANRFDPEMGTRFSTYATFWIKQGVRRAVQNVGRPVRVPVYMQGRLAKLWADGVAVEEETRHERRRQSLTRRAAVRIGQATIHSYNFDEDTGCAFEDLFDSHEPQPHAAAEEADERARVDSLLGRLDPVEATVLRARFGIGTDEDESGTAVGRRLGLGREDVLRIEREALTKLRACVGPCAVA